MDNIFNKNQQTKHFFYNPIKNQNNNNNNIKKSNNHYNSNPKENILNKNPFFCMANNLLSNNINSKNNNI